MAQCGLMKIYYFGIILLERLVVEMGEKHPTTVIAKISGSRRTDGRGIRTSSTFGCSSLGCGRFLGTGSAGGLGRLRLEGASRAKSGTGAADTRAFRASRASSASSGAKLVCVVSSSAANAGGGTRSGIFTLVADRARALASSREGTAGAGTAALGASDRLVLTSRARIA